MPELSAHSWMLAALAGLCIGLAKGGLSGVGLLAIFLFAEIYPARSSTGSMLLSLLVGDLFSIILFRAHIDWKQLRRVILPAFVGVLIGWWTLGQVDDRQLRLLMGGIILGLAGLQLLRNRGKETADLPQALHSPGFAWIMGTLGGWTTMLANSAGPVMSLFFLSMRLPKFVFVGTIAWFFFLVNLAKVPFSLQLGLMNSQSLTLALLLTPFIALGIFSGRWLLHHLPQYYFEKMIILFALIGGLRLILWSG